MQLPTPVEVTLPGRRGVPTTTTITALPVTLIDDARRKTVIARIGPPRTIVLWEGDAYDAVGDYTQAQAEARILEVLGPDIKTAIEQLFSPTTATP